MNNKKLKGAVKWFNDAKGFGFIEHPSGSDVFVHYSVIEGDGFKTLKDGELVLYEIEQGPKGLHAVAVHKAEPTEQTESSSETALQAPEEDIAAVADEKTLI